MKLIKANPTLAQNSIVEKPEGVDDRVDALRQDSDIWLVPDDTPGAVARMPKRTDLPKDHPLYNMRALRNVPAGSMDLVDDDVDGIVEVGPDGKRIDGKTITDAVAIDFG